MQFVKMEPDPNKPESGRMTFDCSCGFTYEQSERVRDGAVD